MKWLLLIVFNLITLSSFCQSKDEKEIAEFMRSEERIWNSGDLEGYVNLYTPDDKCRMLLKKGNVVGRKAILEHYKKYFWPQDKMGTLSLEYDLIEKVGKSTYYVTGFFHVLFKDGKKIDGRYSSIMKKMKGKWYLFADHSA